MKQKVTVEPIHPIAPREAGQPCRVPPSARRLSDTQSQELAQLFKALSDPARLQILDLLSRQEGQICACDFEGAVGTPDEETGQRPKQPTISHHLKVLRDAGLVDAEKHGLWVYYFIRPGHLTQLKDLLSMLCCEGD